MENLKQEAQFNFGIALLYVILYITLQRGRRNHIMI